MPAHRASNLAGQSEFVILDDSAHWLGLRIGGHYWPAMLRTADGRWFAAHWTLAGYDGPPGRPLFGEVTADGAATWFEANRIAVPDELVDDLATPPAPPPAAAGLSGDDRPVSIDARDTNARVKEVLERDRNATSVDIEKATGIPDQTVRRSKAWKEHRKAMDQQKPKSIDAMDHARPLEAPMLAAIDSQAADPAEIAAEREEQDPVEARRRRFIETATSGQRARLHALSPAEQARELEAWDLTGEFLPDEPPDSPPLRRRMGERPQANR